MIDLQGAIDLHVHTAPDVYPRSMDDLELAGAARAAGMRALLLKSHHTHTAHRASLAARHTGLDVFGGLALNDTVGGLNPVAVETALALGARAIWMPTIHARHCLRSATPAMFRAEARRGREGIVVIGPDGRPHPRLDEILEMVRDADVLLATGHLAPEESLALLERASRMGVHRLLVTHPQMEFTRFTRPQMERAVELGALLELNALCVTPGWPGSELPTATAALVREQGAAHCVLATDGGQASSPPPPRMLREFAAALHADGIPRDDLRRMMCDNPARLLYP